MHPDNLKSIAEKIEEETDDEESGEDKSCDGGFFVYFFSNITK